MFKVDLTKIEGEGDFPCPKCGLLISPDNDAEDMYQIIKSNVDDDDHLESVVIQCNKCNSTITLEGFDTLFGENTSRIEISEALSQSEPGVKTRHTLSFAGQSLGHIVVEYAQKEDVKAFKRLRKLRVGEPFKGVINIINTEQIKLENKDFQEIASFMKRTFKTLRNSDIYIVEINGERKNFIGRASNL